MIFQIFIAIIFLVCLQTRVPMTYTIILIKNNDRWLERPFKLDSYDKEMLS